MRNYLTRKNLLSNSQSGFRPKRSCNTALLLVVEEIRQDLDKNNATLLTLLDFSKAFDTVNHSILCNKLRNNFGFSSPSTKLISSYLSGRQQRVISGDSSSSFINVLNGVPQGSILGPTLFSLYVNDLPRIIKHCKIHMYADDVQLFLSRPLNEINNAITALNEDLSEIYKWSIRNDLRLNPDKSKAIAIHRKAFDLSHLPCVLLNQSPIEWVTSAKNLGIVFNRTLSWDTHINTAIAKVYGGLRTLWTTQNFLPTKIKLTLAKSLLLPVLLYGCEIFCKPDERSMRKLIVVYNNIARYVFNLRRRDHVSCFSTKIAGCTLSNLLKIKTLCFLNNLIITRQPEYLFEKIKFFQSPRPVRIIQPRYSCLQSERQFFVQSARLWNSLPAHLREITSTSRFKASIFAYMTREQI